MAVQARVPARITFEAAFLALYAELHLAAVRAVDGTAVPL
jgi:hypothetical protein